MRSRSAPGTIHPRTPRTPNMGTCLSVVAPRAALYMATKQPFRRPIERRTRRHYTYLGPYLRDFLEADLNPVQNVEETVVLVQALAKVVLEVLLQEVRIEAGNLEELIEHFVNFQIDLS